MGLGQLCMGSVGWIQGYGGGLIRFDQPGFTQSFDILEEHTRYYELVFVINDSGFGIEVFIPKTTDIADLLAMCQRYARPAASGAV